MWFISVCCSVKSYQPRPQTCLFYFAMFELSRVLKKRTADVTKVEVPFRDWTEKTEPWTGRTSRAILTRLAFWALLKYFEGQKKESVISACSPVIDRSAVPRPFAVWSWRLWWDPMLVEVKKWRLCLTNNRTIYRKRDFVCFYSHSVSISALYLILRLFYPPGSTVFRVWLVGLCLSIKAQM